MIVDFCHGLWDTRVDSDVVSSDGYEVSNLISRENSKKRKGFLAAGFVKPVVTILLSFPFPIDLYALNINPQVGAQNTCGLEILAASLKPRNEQDIRPTSEANEIMFSTSRRRISRTSDLEFSGLHHYQYNLNINNIKQEFNNLFQQVLRVRIPEGKIGHFVNPCSQPLRQGDSKIVGNGEVLNVHKCKLQHGQLLRRASHLVVRITQCHKGSVPCLGAVEVFGQPAQNSGTFVVNYARLISSRLKETKQEIACGLYTQDETKTPSIGPSNEGSPLATPVTTDSTNSTRSHSDHVPIVPDEFIDPITLSIMTLPVLLPSGTTIDQTTLEKHINCEKNWGRPPSDPFTGLALGSKVVPNAALKCRIDNFLLSSDVSVGDLGRTVGSALLDCRSRAKVINFDVMKMRSKVHLRQKVSGKRTAIVNESNDVQPASKRQKLGVKQTCNSRNPDDLDLALEDALYARKKPATVNQSVSISSLVKASGSTSNGKQRDTESRSSTESTLYACPHHGQDSVLFQLPCRHIVCRRCLTCAVENTQCPNCRRNFDKKNVIRVHSISTNTL